MWKIDTKSKSTTIAVNPDIFDYLNYELCERYGKPQNNKKHGLIYRHVIPDTLQQVAITCYSSTNTVSVQGAGHSTWVDSVLADIGMKLSDNDTPITSTPVRRNSQANSSSSVNFSLNFDDFPPLPCPSTPHICTSTQTVVKPQLCNASTQTELQLVSDNGSQTSLPCDTATTTTTADSLPGQSSSEPVTSTATTTTTTTDYIPGHSSSAIPTIPTSNMFHALEVEDTPDENLPPIPLPWITVCRKSNQRHSTSPKPEPCPTLSTSESTPKPEPSTTHSASPEKTLPLTKRTVLIMGDSIPKYLDGRRMSRRLIVRNECIRGSKLELWIKIAPSLIKQHNPTCVIIHCGTNNISNCIPTQCLDLTVELIHIISHVNPSVSIAISSLIIQGNSGRTAWVNDFNGRLFNLCRETNLAAYIDNSNIGLQHLTRTDGLHLRGIGTKQLAMNYISFLRFFVEIFLNT